MDYKEKYENALDRAKEVISDCSNNQRRIKMIKSIFPELKESEDDKIKRELRNDLILYVPSPERYIAWLEEQGEQKPTEKVEQRFKNGQWIVWQDKCYKVNYDGCGYELVDQNGLSRSLEYETIDENAHLWNITKDAKDGDVLCIHSSESDSDCVFLYQNTYEIEPNRNVAVAYCCIDMYENKIEFGIQGPDCIDVRNVKPATKEQRDLLFQKMKEVGYEWDVEKRELKKIRQNAWSEEDENGLNDALWAIQKARTIAKDENDMGNLWCAENWLKSIKEWMKGE